MQESAQEGKTNIDEVIETVIKRRKYYNIDFQIGVIISHEEIKQDYYSKFMNLTYCFFLQETRIKVSASQVSRWENIKYNNASMINNSLKKIRWLETEQVPKKRRLFFYLKGNLLSRLLKRVQVKGLKCRKYG